MFIDGEHVFEGERLEVEAVAGVVIGGDGFGIAVDHDGLEAVFTEGEGGVATAIVELDALPDAVGTAAENNDLAVGRRRGLVFFVVAGIEVGREAFKLGGAGVDEFVNGTQALAAAEVANLLDAVVAGERPDFRKALVGNAEALGFS